MPTQDIEKLLVQFNADFRGYQREMLKLNGVTDREARKIEQRFRRLNRSINQSLQTAGRGLSAGIGRLGAVAGLGLGTKEVIDYADAWTRSKAQLQVAGVEIDRVAGKQQELLDVAQRSRAAYSATVSLFTRISLAAREMGTSEAEVTRITETLSKALQIGGASTAEASSAMLQFSQALASGVLQGDELRSLRENSPIVAQAIAKEFGVTVGELKELGAQGELTSGRIMKAVLGISEEVDKQFSQLPRTVGSAFTNLQNNVLEAIGVIDNGSGSTEKLVGLINDLAAAIKGLPRAADGVGKALSPLSALFQATGGQGDKIVQALRKGDHKTAAFGGPDDLLRPIGNFFFGEDIEDQLHEINQLQERRLRLEKEISEVAALSPGLPALAMWRKELEAINGELERQINLAGPSFESKGRGAQFPEYVAATGSSPPGKPKPPEKPKNDPVEDVLEALRFEEEQLKRTSREQEIYNQLQRAGIDINSKYGRTIADLAGRIYDAELAKRVFEGNQERIQQMQLEARTMGLTAEAAAYLATKEEMLNEFRREGIAITPELTARIEAEAQALAKAAGNAEQLERIADVNDTVKDSFKGLISDIASGTEPVDALTSALGRLADKLLDLALDDLFQGFNQKSGGGIGAALVKGLGFAKGGVMTSRGAVPLRQYSKGGIANSPQLAEFGEGSRPEAYVPLPDGRSIPVRMQLPSLRPSGRQDGNVNIKFIDYAGVSLRQKETRDSFGRRELEFVIDQRIDRQAADPYSGMSTALSTRGAKNPVKRR